MKRLIRASINRFCSREKEKRFWKNSEISQGDVFDDKHILKDFDTHKHYAKGMNATKQVSPMFSFSWIYYRKIINHISCTLNHWILNHFRRFCPKILRSKNQGVTANLRASWFKVIFVEYSVLNLAFSYNLLLAGTKLLLRKWWT